MLWFEGTIPAAISEAKEKKKLFLVYIEGDDELSKQMNTTYEDQSVGDKLKSDGCVAVKLQANSEACKQFAQIYPVIVIPSSFFIGNDGIPLEVIVGNINPEQFLLKIEKVIEMHRKQHSDSSVDKNTKEVKECDNSTNTSATLNTETKSTNSLSTYQVSSSVAQVNQSADVEMTESSSKHELSKDKEEVSTAQNENEGGDSDEFEQKMKRARRLIEERKIEKEDDEKRKEKEKELERRKFGKELQKAKQERQRNELKEWAEGRVREKEEERLARERVRAQIAQDRAERAARYQQMAEQQQQQQKAEASRKVEQEKSAVEASRRSQSANIQFRLPDGSSVIHQFSASATLREAEQFIIETIRPSFSNFSLSTTFPRREFTTNDYSQTLRDLQLAPSATVLILPTHSGIVQSKSNGLIDIFWYLLSPLTMVWTYLSGIFYAKPTTSNTTNDSKQQPNVSPNESEKSTTNNKQQSPRTNFYQEGNIYRLSNQQGDDDDNNTWNGNSTQQM